MSTGTNFPRKPPPRSAAMLSLLVALAVAVAGGVGVETEATARADEMVLTGPHPALKENSLSLQFVYGSGIGDSFSGRGMGAAYGYRLQGPLWLDLQMNFRANPCAPFACGKYTGHAFELMSGVAWRFRTDIPVVPILRGGAGLVYLYPDGAKSAMGLAVRGGIALRYYLFDWLGFGMEAAMSLGHGFFGRDYRGGHGYAVGDVTAGAEFQF